MSPFISNIKRWMFSIVEILLTGMSNAFKSPTRATNENCRSSCLLSKTRSCLPLTGSFNGMTLVSYHVETGMACGVFLLFERLAGIPQLAVTKVGLTVLQLIRPQEWETVTPSRSNAPLTGRVPAAGLGILLKIPGRIAFWPSPLLTKVKTRPRIRYSNPDKAPGTALRKQAAPTTSRFQTTTSML